MPKVIPSLTNTQVKQAKPTDNKERKISDGGGLQLRVRPNGTKSWLFNYTKPISKKRNTLSFGIYPTISLAEAREKRENAKKLLANGIDPIEDKLHQQRIAKIEANNTFLKIAQNWFEIKKTNIADSTAHSLWRSFENHVFPFIGHRPAKDLLALEVISTLKPLEAKGCLQLTRKIIGHINEVMNHSVNNGQLRNNPLAKIQSEFKTPKPTPLPTIPPDELPEFLTDLSYSNMKITTRCLILWQLHTMVRPGEASGTKWEEIDLENRLWTIPACRMKTNKIHRVPLTNQSLYILDKMRPISSHLKFTFPGDRDRNKSSNSETANKAIGSMGYKGRLVAHGMRSIASTAQNDHGMQYDEIESALAHVEPNRTRASYNRSDFFERRVGLMSWWSQYISNAEKGLIEKNKVPKGIFRNEYMTQRLRLISES